MLIALPSEGLLGPTSWSCPHWASLIRSAWIWVRASVDCATLAMASS
jgi:hypothetical protein